MKQKNLHNNDSELTLIMELSYPLVDAKQTGSNNYCETFATKVMKQTDTVIYCPTDSTNPNARSHNINIVGSLADIERARLFVRESLPMEFVVGCRADRAELLGKDLLRAHFSATFGVMILFNLIDEDASYQVNIRGYRYAFEKLKEAVSHFCSILETPAESVEMVMWASHLHVDLVRNCTKLIEEKSGAKLCCPADNNMVLVRGSLETAYLASEMLTGVTPLHVKFDLPPKIAVDRFFTIAENMDIFISICKTVSGDELILSTYEWNARHLYELRRMWLNLKPDNSLLPSLCPLWIHLVDLHASFINVAKNGHDTTLQSECSDRGFEEEKNYSGESPVLRNV